MVDKHSGNVVQIQDYTGSSRKPGPSNAYRLLHDCTNTVLDRTSAALARAMDNIDDTLFALADKASNDAQQHHYFDAMREVRIKRKDIEAAFKDDFTQRCDAIIDNKPATTPLSAKPSMAEIGLSLVEDDDLEESLAINTLADKIDTLCHNELYGLDKRVGFLLGKKELETADNPIGPKTICDAFKSACDEIKSGVDIKLIVFKLIDCYICDTIQQIYHDINNHLAMSGILPKIPTQIGTSAPWQGGFMAGMESGQGFKGGETDFLSAFSQLLNSGNHTPATGTGHGAYAGLGMPGAIVSPMQGTAGESGQGIPNSLHNLTLMQKGQWAALSVDISTIDIDALANGTANVLWNIKNKQLSAPSDSNDGMVIEIVAMLFDYIFDNQKVPDKAKALIGRLQIPVLKAAMLDNSFFSTKNHPARSLLNTLAQSTIGLLNDGDGDGAFYKGIADCVQMILDDFDTDIGVFETALAGLEMHLESHQTHCDENIEQAKKLIQGRERLMIAESMSEMEIERRLEGKPFPEFIRTFAMDSWKNLLIVIHMKEGRDNENWRSKLEMLDLLIWSTLPKPTLKERKKLVDMLPTLLSGVEEGMKIISMPPSEQDHFMEKLAACHARLVNSEAQVMDAADKESNMSMNKPSGTQVNSRANERSSEPPVERSSRDNDAIQVEEIRLIGQQNRSTLSDGPQQPQQRLNVHLNLFGDASTADLKELVAEIEGERQDEEQQPAAIEDECTELVRNMIPGIWFEFHQDDGSKSMERLAWISSVLGSYLFTNHDGLKTRELSTHEVEDCLRSGRAILADDLSFLVDSTFNELLDDMQKKVAG